MTNGIKANRQALRERNAREIEKLMEKHAGNVNAVARDMGVSRTAIAYYLHRYCDKSKVANTRQRRSSTLIMELNDFSKRLALIEDRLETMANALDRIEALEKSVDQIESLFDEHGSAARIFKRTQHRPVRPARRRGAKR